MSHANAPLNVEGRLRLVTGPRVWRLCACRLERPARRPAPSGGAPLLRGESETFPLTLCQPVAVELKSIDLLQAIKTVRQLEQSCGNLNGKVQNHADTGWHAYLNRAEKCQRQLRNVFRGQSGGCRRP